MVSTFLSRDLSGSRSAFAKDRGREGPTDSGSFPYVLLLLPMRPVTSAFGLTWVFLDAMCLGQRLPAVGCPWLLLKPRSKQKPSVTDSPGQMQLGACFLWCWLPTLVLEQGQVGLVEEYQPLEMQLSNEPELRLRSSGCSL